MATWKLTLEYDGTRYYGWQEQRNSRTVAGEPTDRSRRLVALSRCTAHDPLVRRRLPEGDRGAHGVRRLHSSAPARRRVEGFGVRPTGGPLPWLGEPS